MDISKSNKHAIYTIAIIGFIFTLHLVIPAYSNSSFLNLFSNESIVGLIYMTGSVLSILGFILAPYFLRKIGNYASIVTLIVLEILLFYGLIYSIDPFVLSILFIIQSTTSVLIGYCLDLFLETYTNHHKIGTTRGLYMTVLNLAWVLGPLVGSSLIGPELNYKNTFFASLALLFPLLYLVFKNFRHYEDPEYHHPSFWTLVKFFSKKKELLKLQYVNYILQIFYSWMVVYSPIYLAKFIGFNWSEIGLILVIMLLPFVLFEFPLGKLSDNRFGEKIIMGLGVLIMGISTIFLSMTTEKLIAVWAILFFITRTGASMIEIMIETYLFKVISIKDTEILSSFRIARPASLFFSSGIMIIGLNFLDFRFMFTVIGLLVLTAIIPVLSLKDIK